MGVASQSDEVLSLSADVYEHIKPYRDLALDSPFIREIKAGTLPIPAIRAWIAGQYEYISTMSTWHAMLLRQLDDPSLRAKVLAHVADEQRRDQPRLWLQLAHGWGLSEADVLSFVPCPEQQALSDYFWRLALNGHPVELTAAHCVAIKDLQQEIFIAVLPAITEHYNHRDGVMLDSFAIAWWEAHAPDKYQYRFVSSELLDRYSAQPGLRAKAKFAARRALEYLRLGFDGCYRHAATNGASGSEGR